MTIIPKNIFQTHISYEYIVNKFSNDYINIEAAINTWKRFAPEFEYKFYNDNECDQFMKTHFDDRIYTAYNSLPLGVMKADLWRYCIIYHYGGIYADTDTLCICPNLNEFLNTINNIAQTTEYQLIVGAENGAHFCQWIFSAPKNSPILKSVIDLVIDRIYEYGVVDGSYNNYTSKDHMVHYLTGPQVFTEGIEKYLKENNLPTYSDKRDYTKEYCENNYNEKQSVIKILNHEKLHKKMVIHVYMSMTNGGWKDKRDAFCKNLIL
jgi:mannosyltransferase OCH1-like enzyme